jgi:hypothetical protein
MDKVAFYPIQVDGFDFVMIEETLVVEIRCDKNR